MLNSIVSMIIGASVLTAPIPLASSPIETEIVQMESEEQEEQVPEEERLEKTRMKFGSRGTKIARNVLIGTGIAAGSCAIAGVTLIGLVIWALATTPFIPL